MDNSKGIVNNSHFFAVVHISELVIVSFFAGSGQTEVATILLSVNRLFHLLPLSVILFSVYSWIYLTKHIVMRSIRTAPAKLPKSSLGALYAIDPNGNYQDIGEAASDIGGNFGKSWKPPVEDEYLIIAEFAGSASYDC